MKLQFEFAAVRRGEIFCNVWGPWKLGVQMNSIHLHFEPARQFCKTLARNESSAYETFSNIKFGANVQCSNYSVYNTAYNTGRTHYGTWTITIISKIFAKKRGGTHFSHLFINYTCNCTLSLFSCFFQCMHFSGKAFHVILGEMKHQISF